MQRTFSETRLPELGAYFEVHGPIPVVTMTLLPRVLFTHQALP